MKKIVILLQCLLLSIVVAHARTGQYQEDLRHLYLLDGKKINYSSSVPEAQILKLCKSVEAQARAQEDYENLFIIQQITVNSYCLKGEIGMAVNKAQQMYEEAKSVQSEIGLGLSLQAIGTTYMHSNQYAQAVSTFAEAEKIIHQSDNDFLKIRLMLQQMHVCTLLADHETLQKHLIYARKSLDRMELVNKQDYVFYLQCYQTFYNIFIGDLDLARLSLEDVRKMALHNKDFEHWYFFLSCHCYDLAKHYDKAIAYCDSTVECVKVGGNLNEMKNLMLIKASLLTKNGNKQEAFKMYNATSALSDSLNRTRYIQQIDSLHISYWVDQMAIENATLRNRFLAGWITCAIIVLLAVSVLIYIARKKNKKLILSRRKLEEAKAETADSIQSKSLFLSNMSHELRTPLNAIVGFSDLLATEAIDDAESKQQFGERIKQNADLLLKLFNDVADFSALKENSIKFTADTCDVVPICRNVIDTVDNVKQTAANLFFKSSIESLTLYTDSGRLQQVLINLLVNATKFTSEGEITLQLGIDESRQEALFAVEDTGCGVPLEKQAHIFDRFEKLHDSIQGAGLGLSICQLIVEYTGGRIWIDSTYTKGARFVFTHPLNSVQKL